MKAKKNPKISIERKRGLFFQIGLVITLLAVLIAFEWKSYEKTDYSSVSYTHLTLPTKA